MSLPARPCYAFVQRGSFSGINNALRVALDDRMAPLTAHVIDIKEYRRFGRGVLLNGPPRNILATICEFRHVALRQPRSLVNRRYATTLMFDYGSQRARERAASCQPVFVLQTQTVFDGSLSGCPFYIYTDHTVLANRRYPGEPENVVKSDGWLARERLAYRFADHIFTSSDFARMSLIEDYDCLPEDVTTVGGGVNIEVPPSYPLRKRPVRTILFLGLDWKRKGGPDLVRAFRRLRTSVPDLRLIIAGAAPRLDEPGISVRGVVKPSEVPGLFAEADIFCMPSHVEPSAGVYLEAAAYGLPVVATHVGGTPERVVDGVTGYLCEPGDDVALESLLIELVQSPILASDMGRAGYEMAQTSGTWSIVASRIAAIIRSRI